MDVAETHWSPLFQGMIWMFQLAACNMGVSKNRGTPKWMIYNGNPYENGWFGGTTILGNPHIGHVESGPIHSLVMPCLWGEGRWFFGFVASCSSTLEAMEFRQTGAVETGVSSREQVVGADQKWDHNFAMKFGDYTQIYDPVILHLETSGSHIYLCWFQERWISLSLLEGHGKTTGTELQEPRWEDVISKDIQVGVVDIRFYMFKCLYLIYLMNWCQLYMH